MVIGGRGWLKGAGGWLWGAGGGYVFSHCTGNISHIQPLLSICRCA